MNMIVDTMESTDVMDIQEELTPDQRAYWNSVIERDMCGKETPKHYLTLEEFEQKLTAAAIKLYA